MKGNYSIFEWGAINQARNLANYKLYQQRSAPHEWHYRLLTDASPYNSERLTDNAPYQSNLNQGRIHLDCVPAHDTRGKIFRSGTWSENEDIHIESLTRTTRRAISFAFCFWNFSHYMPTRYQYEINTRECECVKYKYIHRTDERMRGLHFPSLLLVQME